MKKQKKWLSVEKCQEGCKRKVTHVIFLNTPFDDDYIVGACPSHKIEKGVEGGHFPYMTLAAFKKIMEGLIAKGVTVDDLPFEIANTVDRDLKRPRITSQLMDWTEHVIPVEERHSFGGTSDLCLYCGCGYGWFNRNLGKRCPDRLHTAPLCEKPKLVPRVLMISTGRKFR